MNDAPGASPVTPGERDHPHRVELRRLQHGLERFYGLESAPDVLDFVHIGDEHSRETLLLREANGELEIALVLPSQPPGVQAGNASDVWLQLAEGVSHFVYIAERARTGLPATRLELELQAEVDKFVLLALGRRTLPASRSRPIVEQLYQSVRFLDPPGSEAGERYRLANDLAARFVARLLGRDAWGSIERELRRFYRSGQAEKIRLAGA